MSGKVLKISSNDLYGNVDDRIVRVYACFQHSKYTNNYVIFSIDGDNKKLCFGSIHMKDKSLVIFSVKDNIKKYILEFIDEYMNSKLNNFKILKIDNINKVELVSYNDMEYDNLLSLDEKSIPKVVVKEEEKTLEKKPIFLYIIVLILILFAIGLTVLYLKPEWFAIKYKGLECSHKLYDDELELYYDIKKDIVFDVDDKLESIDVTNSYIFLDSDSYYEFKDNNNKEDNPYFTDGEGYKFVDEELRFKLFYEETTVIDDYDEMLTYLKREGYSCVEREYEK